MRKEIFQEIEIPEGVEVNINEDEVFVKGKEGELKRKFKIMNLSIQQQGNKIVVGNKKSTKKEKKMINTTAAHLRNMIRGVGERYEYHLKICSSHFPISVEINGRDVMIKNFLGEKIPRKTHILEGVDVDVNKDIITVSSTNKELAGQTAANFEKATWIKARDRRVFQDGIFITSKAGKKI